MASKPNRRIEFGDFQTPSILAREVCEAIQRLGVSPRSIIEPTCGSGSLLDASLRTFPSCEISLGFEINMDHAKAAKKLTKSRIICEDFFQRDWNSTLNGLPGPILVIGNPPWVTNSQIGAINGRNLPVKTNAERFSGIDAMTGRSNFDISEWMLTRLLECLDGRIAVLAMLCKSVVARKILKQAWSARLQIDNSAVYSIDATKYFGASVDACLLICVLKPNRSCQECSAFASLNAVHRDSTFALRNGRLVANLASLREFGHLHGTSPIRWRSGIKHDCSRVMELQHLADDRFSNRLGETVTLEDSFLYPMLKSSELMKSRPTPRRYMLVTQRKIGEDTLRIQSEAPRVWDYLKSHATSLDNRSSSIYKNQPRFSIFGVGTYSFLPWKVAISGFYKRLQFQLIGPFLGKPVVLDDTCYFLPFRHEDQAKSVCELLNSRPAREYLNSYIFWDAKRPITAGLLRSLDLAKLADECKKPLPPAIDTAEDIPLLASIP